MLSAAALTLLMAGLLTGWLDALVLFAYFLGLTFVRRALQQARPAWLQALQRVPALLRLAAGLGLGYLASRLIIEGLWGSTQTFLPVWPPPACR